MQKMVHQVQILYFSLYYITLLPKQYVVFVRSIPHQHFYVITHYTHPANQYYFSSFKKKEKSYSFRIEKSKQMLDN